MIESATAFLLETGNTSLMPLIRSFQAELALRQGRISTAGQWAAHLDPIPPFRPVYGLFWPHLTLVKTWLAQDTPASRKQAANLLDASREFVEATHNARFLIEVLALQALLKEVLGERPAALKLLERAVALAEPGGFVRLFVDLGPGLVPLLHQLRQKGLSPDYLGQVLVAFPDSEQVGTIENRKSGIQNLVEPLTPRESEVLAMLGQRLTNQEIADELVVSPSTVKTHTLNIYGKLGVHSRKQAVAKAQELGLQKSDFCQKSDFWTRPTKREVI
jgi:LuxR family maltose regulon positive regulatory protein